MNEILHGVLGCPSYDEQCQQDVCAALLGASALDARRIDVGVGESGQITLDGSVRSRRQRELALEIARRAAAGRDVVSRLRLSSR